MKRMLTFALALSLLLLSACGITPANPDTAKLEAQNVYEDDFIRVLFYEVHEEEKVPGCAYLEVRLENKSEYEMTVLTSNSTVNGEPVDYLTSLPAVIRAGSHVRQSWYFPFTLAPVEAFDEIKTLTFTLDLYKEGLNPLETTGVITLQKGENWG